MEKKMNNKGFSLVELIVVIAIMAVLIGVLAPQFIKYVEKSRVATDVQNVDQIVTAIQTYAAENGYPSETDTWNISDNESPTAGKFIEKALQDANVPAKLKLKSSHWTTKVQITVTSTGVSAVGENANGQKMANQE